MFIFGARGLLDSHPQEREAGRVMSMGAEGLFRAVTALLIVLVALVLNGTSALACDGHEKLDVAAQVVAGSLARGHFDRADAAAQAIIAADIYHSGTDPGVGDPGCDLAGHCLGCRARCSCSVGGIVSSVRVDFLIPPASLPRLTALPLRRSGLARSPDERPPRLA